MSAKTTRCPGCGDDANLYAARVGRKAYCETCNTVQAYKGFTRAELKDAFDRVCDPANWKNPINVLLGNLEVRECDAIAAAVVFYAGCEASLVREGTKTRVTAAGYYAAVGA
jgi:hypothetical protein